MNRPVAMLILLGMTVCTILTFLALFAKSPIFSTCISALFYTLYLFFSHEK